MSWWGKGALCLSHLHTADTKSYHAGWFGIAGYLGGWFGPQWHWCKKAAQENRALCGLCCGPAWFLHRCERMLSMAGRHPGTAAALDAPVGVCFCLPVHQDTLTPVLVCVRPWLCRLAVHSLGESQVGRVRQHPPTMSRINPWDYSISVNRITGLDMKLCLCSHRCGPFLHCKVGKVTRVGGGGRLQSGSRTAVPMFLKALSWAWYM